MIVINNNYVNCVNSRVNFVFIYKYKKWNNYMKLFKYVVIEFCSYQTKKEGSARTYDLNNNCLLSFYYH